MNSGYLKGTKRVKLRYSKLRRAGRFISNGTGAAVGLHIGIVR